MAASQSLTHKNSFNYMISFRFLISVAFIALSTVCQAQSVDEATARDTGIEFLNAKKTENVSLKIALPEAS